ncbi:hypothetical protein SAMN04487897_12533 [Paenibacillus sp. yr247]|uniref:hypothetical protein n=1 Tax=Paenibacillus sp. yr247 TaxID=1761880 RepID=UPI00088F29D6|nr:hypothetical protein [Paenibacillus sp. yr247]SDO87544.1 hypothetical protein SAMN04487897_12533 [Paenibacillus sp. yr247]
MTFDPVMYKTNRSAVYEHYNVYLSESQNFNSIQSVLVESRNKILSLWHYELLILQSSIEQWQTLMNDPSLNFRRGLCAKLLKLERAAIMDELDLSNGAVSNLFNESTKPNWPRPFQLSVLFEHPWQLVNYESPDPYSYLESPEYFEERVSKKMYLQDLVNERSKVTSIRGYVILDAPKLFLQESNAVTGRWVTTYPEFDYFEFHLNSEPLVNNVLRKGLQELFPLAKHVITTYRPFKPLTKRSLWVIVPKNENLPSYAGMLHELKEYREHTEYHRLR